MNFFCRIPRGVVYFGGVPPPAKRGTPFVVVRFCKSAQFSEEPFFYILTRPSIDLTMVAESAYSKSAPTGSPRAMRDTVIFMGIIIPAR